MKKLTHITLLLLLPLLLTCISVPTSKAAIRTVTGTITKITDGDTVHLTTPEQTKLKVRLYGIDAPETDKINNKTGRVNIPGQPYGDESMNALANKIMGKKVKVDILDIDKYRRMVGMIYLENRNINLEMIREGYAEAFIEYLKEPYKSDFLKVERDARAAKKGIWSLPAYERPREFRKRLKVRGAESF
ncbi:MAG: thermonuclease family protein [Smithella sp.]|nr:thermonuclease family protein [Smithella sp.]